LERILVADDELSMREFLEIFLTKEGYAVDVTDSGEDAIKKLSESEYDLIICDMMMPRGNGMEVLKKAKELEPDMAVIMITAFASAESAVEAMKIGANDYITKPFQVDEIKLVVKNSLEKVNLKKENQRLRHEVESKYVFNNIVGSSASMKAVYGLIKNIAPTRSNILIQGESGTGKELVAKSIHYNSTRRDQAYVTVNCGAIPSELLESELFGHLKGSFTGAYQDTRGLFEAAHKGTLFLDEIGDTPLPIQVKLLRAIQEKTFKPVGGIKDISVDVRVIAASNRDLEERVKSGHFREDLFYRLNVIQVRIPHLRERKEDIGLLTYHFLSRFTKEIGKDVKDISPEAERVLHAYNWPGNVRELENAIERAVSLTKGDRINLKHLPDKILQTKKDLPIDLDPQFPEQGVVIDEVLAETERMMIEESMKRALGVKKKAAELLGLSIRSLRYRMDKLGMEVDKDDD
jgi:two-component system, NtrC family, response regulator PilR